MKSEVKGTATSKRLGDTDVECQSVPLNTAWRVLSLRVEERPAIWRVAVYILNKQLWTADKGWSSSLGLGQVVTIPHHKNWPCYEMDMCLWAGLVLWHDLSNGKGT